MQGPLVCLVLDSMRARRVDLVRGHEAQSRPALAAPLTNVPLAILSQRAAGLPSCAMPDESSSNLRRNVCSEQTACHVNQFDDEPHRFLHMRCTATKV
jgi:hypothetical protein